MDKATTLNYVAPKTPLQFVGDNEMISEKIAGRKARRGKHIVMFYEEPEYAALVSFNYIKGGLDVKDSCGYVSKDANDIVRNEIMASPLDFDELISRGVLKVVQFQDLSSYPKGSRRGLKDIASLLHGGASSENLPRTGRRVILDRTVLKCMYKVNMKKDVQTNMSLERQHHVNFGVFGESSLLVTYHINDILSTIRGESGIHSKWMELLVKKYDAVIFAYSLLEGGIALNLV